MSAAHEPFFCRHWDRHSPVALCTWQLGREVNHSDVDANMAESAAERVRVTVPSTWPSPVLECKRGKSESEPLSTATVGSQVIDNLSRANCILARSMDARRIEHDEINTAVPGADNNTLHAETSVDSRQNILRRLQDLRDCQHLITAKMAS